MKSDNTIRNGTSIFVGIIVAIAAFVHGALTLPHTQEDFLCL